MSSRLAALIQARGFPDADFERFFTIMDSATGKHAQRKPDVVFSDGGTHIVSAKDGERLERESIATAIQYIRDLSPVTNLGEVFALTYAKKGESFHLHILPSGSRQEVSLVLDTLGEVADAITGAVKGKLVELEQRQEPIQEEAKRLLRYAAIDLADLLEGVPETELEEIFGGHNCQKRGAFTARLQLVQFDAEAFSSKLVAIWNGERNNWIQSSVTANNGLYNRG